MGKRFIFILMACSLLSIATVVHAQHIDKQTYIFAIKKVDTLKLDKYVMIDQIFKFRKLIDNLLLGI